MSTITLQITNGLIVLISGVILYGIKRIFDWAHSIDQRLDVIERSLGRDKPEQQEKTHAASQDD